MTRPGRIPQARVAKLEATVDHLAAELDRALAARRQDLIQIAYLEAALNELRAVLVAQDSIMTQMQARIDEASPRSTVIICKLTINHARQLMRARDEALAFASELDDQQDEAEAAYRRQVLDDQIIEDEAAYRRRVDGELRRGREWEL